MTERQEKLFAIIEEIEAEEGTARQNALRDLLVDLRHVAAGARLDMRVAIGASALVFNQEVDSEAGEKPEVPNVLRITVDHDANATNPVTEDDGWQVYTFGEKRVLTDADRDRFFDPETGEPDEELARKLATGLAFGCERTSHGPVCETSLRRHGTEGGLVIWERPEDLLGTADLESRRKQAEQFLERYTEWQNGRCYSFTAERIISVAPGYDINRPERGAIWEEVEHCGDFIGADSLNAYIQEEVLPDYQGAAVVKAGGCRDVLEIA